MTGRLRQGEAVFSNHVLFPFDRAPRGLSVSHAAALRDGQEHVQVRSFSRRPI
jgi:hypothetical protein